MKYWLMAAGLALASTLCAAQGAPGYFRKPTVHGEVVVFTADGDLWRTTVQGGSAVRLTHRAGDRARGAISPDGQWLAFSAAYDGPLEIYVMPVAGGIPKRLTWSGEGADIRGWTPGGEILYATRETRTLGEPQLATVSPTTSTKRLVPLADGRDGSFIDANRLVFTRHGLDGDNVRAYRGGKAATLWLYDMQGKAEAVPLTQPTDGNAHDPMAWRDRIIYLSDHDGVTNLWSMDTRGGDRKKLTSHRDFEVRAASVSGDFVVYQQGADLHLLNLSSGSSHVIPIALVSDFDQLREQWITRPLDQLTALAISGDGSRVALTARGHVALAGLAGMRRVDVAQAASSRLRNAVFMPDGRNVLAVSDASGENELWLLPADGSGPGRQLTRDGDVMRWDAVPSPDGRWIAHHDKKGRLWLLEVATGQNSLLNQRATAEHQAFFNLTWSPDSRALAVDEVPDVNEIGRRQIVLYRIADRSRHVLTSTRYASVSPAFSPDGRWLWFISSRDFQSLNGSPWGDRYMGPYFDRREGIYAIALQPGNRFPFKPADELHAAQPADLPASGASAAAGASKAATASHVKPSPPAIVWEGLAQRLYQVPIQAGNYASLKVDSRQLWLLEAETSPAHKTALKTVQIQSEAPGVETWMPDVREFELSGDMKKVAVRRWAQTGPGAIHLLDAAAKPPADLAKATISIDDWRFAVQPEDELRQMFNDAWRMHRDWYYDPQHQGVDWPAMRQKYAALLPRVSNRAELEDLTAQMVAELSLLHSQVGRGSLRRAEVDVYSGVLGAEFDKVPEGMRVRKIYRGDPERITSLGPLARPDSEVSVGDIVTAVDGKSASAVPDMAMLLRDKANKQVLLDILDARGERRRVVVVPQPVESARNLRLADWSWERRRRVEAASNGRFGYMHLSAMLSRDLAEFAREFYAASAGDGLIIDMRHNDGGNIDSILIEKLLRKAWETWQSRDGSRLPNMPNAFRGQLVVIVDQGTYSDGETFSEGIKRLKLGTVVGMRTAGAGVWLDDDNLLADGGIARAAQDVQVGLDGVRLIEGIGVTPDIEVDNLPHASFEGQDAQLEVAIRTLRERIAKEPRVDVPPFIYPRLRP